MTGVWLTVLLVAALAVGMKSVGPVALGGRELPVRVRQGIVLLAPTLLAALIATGIFSVGHSLTIDARAVGLGVGALALWLRAPALAAIGLAALATALTRLLF